MAGCDAKTGWSKSEFRDICQNKLAQLSVDVFSPLGRALALHFRGKDKLVVPLFHCFCAEYQPSEHAAICRHIFQKVQALLSEIYSSLNIKVEFKYLPLTLAFTFIETIVLKKTLSGVKGLAQGPTAVLARLGTSGGFHTHAERFWEHDCLHSRWHFGMNFAWKSTFILHTNFRFECVCKLRSSISPLMVGVTCPKWVGLWTFAHFCIREKSRSSTKKCFSCLHKPKDRPHSAAAPAAL